MSTPAKAPASADAALTPIHTGLLQRKCACGGSPGVDGECEECRNKHLSLQRQATAAAAPPAVPPIVHEVLNSPGQPLDTGTRAFMEPRFGHDFSQVRVHTDARATESARALNALAYTVGRDVVFGTGQYGTGTLAGQRLLAHELTHVVQQEGQLERFFNSSAQAASEASSIGPSHGPYHPISIDSEDTAHEHEAEIAAAQVTNAGRNHPTINFISPIVLSRASSLRLQRRTIREDYATAALETGPVWNVTLTITHAPESDSEAVQDFIDACMDGVRDAAESLGGGVQTRTRNIRVTISYRRRFDYVAVSQEAFAAARRSVLGEVPQQAVPTTRQRPPVETQHQQPQPTTPQPPSKTIIVIGSPSPDQTYQLQFVTAAECQPRDANTIWLIERTGYDLYGIPLNYFERYHPLGGYGWITPDHNLVGWLNSMPDHSIGKLMVYSHGVPGLVTLRYGWGGRSPDYGLSIPEVARLNRNKFTEDAVIEFNSCNTGTDTGSGNLAQSFATQVGRPVEAWTGRTSYAGINRGTCSVGPSTITSVREFFAEGWSTHVRGRTPRLETFQP